MSHSYSDLGKQARDVLQKGYNDSKLRVGVLHLLPHHFSLGTSAWYDHVSKKSDAILDAEYKINSKADKVNLSVKRGFSLNNGASFSLAASGGDRWGIKSAGVSFNQSGKLGLSYYNERFNGDISFVTLPESGSVSVTPTLCVSYSPVALGFTSSLVPIEALCVSKSLAAGFIEKNFSACVFFDASDSTRVSGSLYGRVNPEVELAARVGIDLDEASSHYLTAEGGVRYSFEKATSISAKLNKELKLSLNCCRDLSAGIKASASLVFDVGGLSLAKTKFGFGVDIDHDWGRRSSSSVPAPPPPPEETPPSSSSSSPSSISDGKDKGGPFAQLGPYSRRPLMKMRVSGLKEAPKSEEACNEDDDVDDAWR